MQERQEAEESEDGMGNPLYIKERCKNYKMLQEETAKLKTEFADKKAHIIKSNKQLEKQGSKLMKVPGEFKPNYEEDAQKIDQFKTEYLQKK